jgi:hypothetical protein
MLWIRDFELEWVERGCKRTLELRSQPLTFDYWKRAQAEANRRGRTVTVYELRRHRINFRVLRKRIARVRPTTELRFMTAADPPKPRGADAARRRQHRAAERAGQMLLGWWK